MFYFEMHPTLQSSPFSMCSPSPNHYVATENIIGSMSFLIDSRVDFHPV